MTVALDSLTRETLDNRHPLVERHPACHYRNDQLHPAPRDNSMTAYETRTRPLNFFSAVGTTRMDYYTGASDSSRRTSTIQGRQRTTSRDNPDWALLRLIRKNGWGNDAIRMTDIGGSFSTSRHSYSHSHPFVRIGPVNAPGARRSYTGPQFAAASVVGPTSSYWPKPPADLFSEMVSKGATAIARTSPTNPSAGVAQMLGELKERLPSVPGRSLIVAQGSPAKKLADEYLNLEFGLKPMVKDLREIGKAARDSAKILRQLERDSGRLVRRRYAFPVEVSTTGPVVISTNAAPQPSLDSYLYADASGVLTKETTTVRRFWFSGAFTYYYSSGTDLGSKISRAEQSASRLFGTRLTPELLWELTPWSWAVDWVSNMGDVVHNVSMFANDGLVLRHGYIMANVVTTDTYVLSGITYQGGAPQTFVQSFTTEVKQRMEATPYGFGLKYADFTDRQWAILAALGVSRSRAAQ